MPNNLNSSKKKIKDGKVSAEVRRLRSSFAKMDEKTKATAKALIENAAFMSVTLFELQAQMNENGLTDTYQNGEHQSGTKKSPEVEIYNTMIKNYSGIIKQLTDLLPDAPVAEPKDDALDNHLRNRPD